MPGSAEDLFIKILCASFCFADMENGQPTGVLISGVVFPI